MSVWGRVRVLVNFRRWGVHSGTRLTTYCRTIMSSKSDSESLLPLHSWALDSNVPDQEPSPPSVTIPLSASLPSDLPFISWSIDNDIPTTPPHPSPNLFVPLAAVDGPPELPFTAWTIDTDTPTAHPCPSPGLFVPLAATHGLELPFATWSIDYDIPTAPPCPTSNLFVPLQVATTTSDNSEELPVISWSNDDGVPTAAPHPSPGSFQSFNSQQQLGKVGVGDTDARSSTEPRSFMGQIVDMPRSTSGASILSKPEVRRYLGFLSC
jgi:hypothetical protein